MEPWPREGESERRVSLEEPPLQGSTEEGPLHPASTPQYKGGPAVSPVLGRTGSSTVVLLGRWLGASWREQDLNANIMVDPMVWLPGVSVDFPTCIWWIDSS